MLTVTTGPRALLLLLGGYGAPGLVAFGGIQAVALDGEGFAGRGDDSRRPEQER